MRSAVLCTALMGIASVSTVRAGGSAVVLPPEAQRAAYCYGAVNETIKQMASEPPVDTEFCELNWKSKGFQSQAACNVSAGSIGTAMLRKRADRYWRYLTATMVSLGFDLVPNGPLAEMMLITQTAATDVRERRKLPNHGISSSCFKQCTGVGLENGPSCLASCMDRIDEVEGNILRCLSMPDQLPY